MSPEDLAGLRFTTTMVEVEGREEEVVVEIPPFEPLPWGARTRLETVGHRAVRTDAVAKVTGSARYTADIQIPGMLHARLVRSPIACGTMSDLAVRVAWRVPGVRAVLTPRDVAGMKWLHGAPPFHEAIHYEGQPVAAVAADDPIAARAAARAIVAGWRSRTPIVGPAPGGMRRGRGPARVEVRRRHRGNVLRAIRGSPAAVTQVYRVPAVLHQALEPHGCVACWHGDRLTVFESTQGIFRVRRQLARHLGLRIHQVRVVSDYMGGGFGAKNGCGVHTIAAALLSRATGRPVKLVLDRREESLSTGHRPETVMRVTLAAGRDGLLTAIDFEAWIALGADGWIGGPGQVAYRMYRCPHVRTVEHYAYTHAGPMSAFRAPYFVEGAFALESAMDLLARRLRRDPLELRLRNLATSDPERDRPYSANALVACYADVARRIAWSDRRGGEPQADTVARVARGVGVAAQVWGAAGGPPAYAEVRVHRDGTALVVTGTQDLGTGTRTILAQIAAEVLGLPPAAVHVVLGDTDAGPYAGNSWGSMTTASVGPAVRMAAEDAKRQLFQMAAELLGVSAARLSVRRGRIVAGTGRKSVAFERVTEHLGEIMIVGRGHRGPNPESVTVATFGAQAAEVEVELDTGMVRVLRLAAAHDCGRAINPELAESQIHGGLLQGLGYALFERRVQDPASGLTLNAGLHDYKIPTMADVPYIEARVISSGDPVANHIGARGLAEAPIIPTAPAIANAVFHALGVQPTDLPLTPATILALVRKRRRRRARGPAPGASGPRSASGASSRTSGRTSRKTRRS